MQCLQLGEKLDDGVRRTGIDRAVWMTMLSIY
jgi:hypothetical protein